MQDGGKGDGQSGDVGQCIQIRGAVAVANPETLLPSGLEAGIVSLALGAQGIGSLEIEAASINGKPVIRWQRFIFGTAAVLLAIVPIWVVTRTDAGFGLSERTAEFLSGSTMVGGFSVLVHRKTRFTDGIACRQLFGGFRSPLIQRDNGISPVNILYQIVDRFRVIALVADEGTLFDGQDSVGGVEDILHNSGIRDVGGSGQFIEGQPGDTVHQHMVFVTPVELVTPFIMLVRCGMDTQGAVRIGLGVVLWLEFILGKRLWIVLLCVRRHRRGVQANKRGIHNAQFIELLHQTGHDLLQRPVVQLFQEPVVSPVGWQRSRDVKAAVMGDEPVIVQIIGQVGDL